MKGNVVCPRAFHTPSPWQSLFYLRYASTYSWPLGELRMTGPCTGGASLINNIMFNIARILLITQTGIGSCLGTHIHTHMHIYIYICI